MGLQPLVSPVGSNFLSDWPSQNAENCDKIDLYAGPCLTSHPLQAYTPLLTASTTNPSVGAGQIKGLYYKIFDQVFVFAQVRFGAGLNVGSGFYIMNLPFAINQTFLPPTSNPGGAPIIGSGHIFDASAAAGRQPLVVQMRTSSTVQFQIRSDSGASERLVSHVAPVAWADGDFLTFSAKYRRAD